MQDLNKLHPDKSHHSGYGGAEIPPLDKEILLLLAHGKGKSISFKDVTSGRSTVYLGSLYSQEYLGEQKQFFLRKKQMDKK